VERDVGSVRRECLDPLLIVGERQLRRVLAAYAAYFNASRPHPGIDQQVPCGPPTWAEPTSGTIMAFAVLSGLHGLHGLHHEYRRAA
jgi:hypothetical protein